MPISKMLRPMQCDYWSKMNGQARIPFQLNLPEGDKNIECVTQYHSNNHPVHSMRIYVALNEFLAACCALNILSNSKSVIFSNENGDLPISKYSSKTHCASNN